MKELPINFDIPISFTIGLDGLPYAVLPNEFEAEDYANIYLQGDSFGLACCGGFFNGVRLQHTIGM